MAKLISPEVINEIQDRCDIVEIISSYIPLKKAGRNFKANCPFHNEKTPSFVVSPDKQIYHCFGCGKGGNILNFLIEYERIDFKEALETLAKRAGVVLKFEEKENDKEKSLISELYRINELACDFYEKFLLKQADNQIIHSLQSRGLTQETIKRFKIGLSSNQWDAMINHLRAKNISLDLMEKAGLIITKEDGGFYDRFRNRLIIPISDVKNRIIAFGARALGDIMPKYINSPETPTYIKGRNLFGLNIAKDAIKEKDCCVIVEGYFDVIIPMQEGFLNIVASSGTALTIEQIRLLKRYTKNVIVVYDSDSAGQLATIRSLDLFLEEDVHVKIVSLPKGYDPDLFVRKFSIQKFQELVDNSMDIFNYKLKILYELYNVKEMNEKTKIAIEMLTMIKRVKNEILKSEYIKALSERISINETSLIKEFNKIKLDQFSYGEMPKQQSAVSSSYPKFERMLIKLILEDIKTAEIIKDFISPLELQDKILQKILESVLKLYESYKQLKPNQIINYIQDQTCVNTISELTNEDTLNFNETNRDHILKDCIKRIKFNNINLQCQNLQTEIKNAQSQGNTQSLNRLTKEFNALIKQKKNLEEASKN